eukprot:SM000004S15106  [mRNA]  locus=s4:1239196:1242035:- [translate_table: standard]
MGPSLEQPPDAAAAAGSGGGARSAFRPLRLAFLTLEYKAGTFSGNGVYSQSMVRSLSKLGHSVLVLSGRPPAGAVAGRPRFPATRSGCAYTALGVGPRCEPGYSADSLASPPGWGRQASGAEAAPAEEVHGVRTLEAGLVEIPVPVWGRLDWRCGWKEFAAGVSPTMVAEVVRFRPDWVLIVDWSALDAYHQLAKSEAWEAALLPLPPMAYLNYRVYTLSEYQGNEGEQERAFYRAKESDAVAIASAVVGLSSLDASYLKKGNSLVKFFAELGAASRPDVRVHALLPPLREDIRVLATARMEAEHKSAKEGDNSETTARSYLSCCVRLSPEKNAELFASLVEELAPFLQSEKITPLLCLGAGTSTEYAERVKERVVAASPDAVLIHGFMGPQEMATVYSQTLLNIHPCVYDAYGMTVVEAAAFGAPSIVHQGPAGAVGATELLHPAQGLAVGVDLSSDATKAADKIAAALKDRRDLAAVGQKASAKSIQWSEEANALMLTEILVTTLGGPAPS